MRAVLSGPEDAKGLISIAETVEDADVAPDAIDSNLPGFDAGRLRPGAHARRPASGDKGLREAGLAGAAGWTGDERTTFFTPNAFRSVSDRAIGKPCCDKTRGLGPGIGLDIDGFESRIDSSTEPY